MSRCYDLYFGETVIGQVTVVRQGLYDWITCTCMLPDRVMYRLWARTDTDIVDLGILYPQNGSYGLNTRLPMKRLGQGRISFFAEEKDKNEHYVFLDEGKPFTHLQQLEYCRFAIRDGKPALKLSCEKNG